MSETLTLQDIRDVWDDVRPGLEWTKQKVGAPWRPEDIYAACIAGKAFLYSGETGYVVVQPKSDPFNGKAEMFVWVAYANEGQDNIERFQSSVDALAAQFEFDKMTMWSNRPGFQRVPGWTQVAVVYERQL